MYKIAYSPIYVLPLPAGHRFPMAKYELIPEQLLYEGTIESSQLFTPLAVENSIAELVHTKSYIEKLITLQLTEKEIRRSGFPLTRTLIEREFIICGGTCEGAVAALKDGIAFNIAGGTHHAYADKAEGFCLLNDQAVAAAYLLKNKQAKRILIVDLDVHQGNGTASIFNNTPEVFTFSMHAGHNFPLQKERSDLDISLPDGCTDEVYLDTLRDTLPYLLTTHQPDFIFYQSGTDILQTDKLGRLQISRNGCKERDQQVLELAHRNEIPLMVTMGGGYSPKISDIVEAHCNTFRIAATLYS